MTRPDVYREAVHSLRGPERRAAPETTPRRFVVLFLVALLMAASVAAAWVWAVTL